MSEKEWSDKLRTNVFKDGHDKPQLLIQCMFFMPTIFVAAVVAVVVVVVSVCVGAGAGAAHSLPVS